MDATPADFLELSGLLLPDGRLVWERLRATSDPEAPVKTEHSPVQAVQVGEGSEVVGCHDLPVEPVNRPTHPDISRIRGTERVEGLVPLDDRARILAIRIEGNIVTEYDIPCEHTTPSESSSGRPERELSAVDRADPDLDIRILHPKAQRRYPLAPVLFEALVFVDDELTRLSDEHVHWFVDHKKVVSGRRALWSEPAPGRHALHAMVEYHGETVMAETRLTVRSKYARQTGSIQRTGT